MLCHVGIFWRYTGQETLANPPKISNGLFIPIKCPRNIYMISGINMDKRLNTRNPINIPWYIILYLGYVFLTLNSCFFLTFFPVTWDMLNIGMFHGGHMKKRTGKWRFSWENHGKMEVLMEKPKENHRKMEVYPLVICYTANWKDPSFSSWVNPLFLWQFSIAM